MSLRIGSARNLSILHALTAALICLLTSAEVRGQETQGKTCFDTCQDAKEAGLRNFNEGDGSLVCCCHKTVEGTWIDAAIETCEAPDLPKATPTPLEDIE